MIRAFSMPADRGNEKFMLRKIRYFSSPSTESNHLYVARAFFFNQIFINEWRRERASKWKIFCIKLFFHKQAKPANNPKIKLRSKFSEDTIMVSSNVL